MATRGPGNGRTPPLARAGVVVLGTGQDAGVPQVGCDCPTCERAWRDDTIRRLPPALGVWSSDDEGLVYGLLVDASPQITVQLAMLQAASGRKAARRHPVDRILLTHAHIGHYLGLALLGREGASTHGIPVLCSKTMDRFVRANRPFSHLVERSELVLQVIAPGKPLDLLPGVRGSVHLVPHRGEDSDTLALSLEGAGRSVLYMPDVDRLGPEELAMISHHDVCLVDGTFFSSAELQGRTQAEVPHPPMEISLRALPRRQGVYFTHINHSNPVLLQESVERAALTSSGHALAVDGQWFALGSKEEGIAHWPWEATPPPSR